MSSTLYPAPSGLALFESSIGEECKPLASGQELTFPAQGEECGHSVRSKLQRWSSFTLEEGDAGI